MKCFISGLALILSACAHRPENKVSNVARDTMADGLIEATVVKKNSNQEVCFDITLKMKGVEQNDASASNWTAALVGEDSRYHLLNLTQRDPASVPRGDQEMWMSNFKTCAPQARMGGVRSLVLTPKTLPYPETEGMTLEWK